jgi:hypothetical protein
MKGLRLRVQKKNMNIATILVTRSKSCHVKTLHTVLRINVQCLQKNINNQIVYVDDDPFLKAEMVQKYIKNNDRIIFIDFGIGMDDDSIKQCFEPHDTIGCLVFPGVKEGVDWGLFRARVKDGSSEPVSQMGLHFDTEIGMKISEDIYRVKTTNARAWVMNTKNVTKAIKKSGGGTKIYAKMFEKLIEQGVRVYAFSASKLTMTYTHECLSNILNAAGVKVN